VLGYHLVCGNINHIVLDGEVRANGVDVETLLVVHENDLRREEVHEHFGGSFKRVVGIKLEHHASTCKSAIPFIECFLGFGVDVLLFFERLQLVLWEFFHFVLFAETILEEFIGSLQLQDEGRHAKLF
jgi:hypothetical protein